MSTFGRGGFWGSETVGTVFRLVLSGVLLYAGGAKLLEANGARNAINAYRVFPPSWAPTLGYALPAVEVGVGLLLLAGLYVRASAIFTAVLMLTFITLIISVWVRGYSINCGCFGGGGDVSAAGRAARYSQEIARDSAFVLMAAWLARWPRTRAALERA